MVIHVPWHVLALKLSLLAKTVLFSIEILAETSSLYSQVLNFVLS
jgi:hypothetical protein